MNVSLTPELESFVHTKVKTGRYNSASEVVREALRLLEDIEKAHSRLQRKSEEQRRLERAEGKSGDLRPRPSTLDEVTGSLRPARRSGKSGGGGRVQGKPKSLAEMEAAIAVEVRERRARGRY